jgi:hypothetical protein
MHKLKRLQTSDISSTDQDKPHESGKILRRGGLGFYSDRGRVYRFNRTHFRDQNRTPEAREACQLARQLLDLIKEHPRFKVRLEKLRRHVLFQNRSQLWKSRTVFGLLSETPIALSELVEETGLDKISIKATLEELYNLGKAVPCDRRGKEFNSPDARRFYWKSKSTKAILIESLTNDSEKLLPPSKQP